MMTITFKTLSNYAQLKNDLVLMQKIDDFETELREIAKIPEANKWSIRVFIKEILGE